MLTSKSFSAVVVSVTDWNGVLKMSPTVERQGKIAFIRARVFATLSAWDACQDMQWADGCRRALPVEVATLYISNRMRAACWLVT